MSGTPSFLSRLRRPGITAKLFLAMFAVCGITALGMGLASRASFQTGFLDYLVEIEQERIAALAQELEEEYGQSGSFDNLRETKNWRKLINRFARNEPEKSPDQNIEGAPGSAGKKPRKDKKYAVQEEFERARRNWESAHLRSSLSLLETDKETLIAGVPPSPDASWAPVTFEGRTVAWLSRRPMTGITDTIDLRFQERQRTGTIFIGLFGLALAAIASVITSRMLIAPLRRFADTTSRLAAGDFTARVVPAPSAGILTIQGKSVAGPGGVHLDELQTLAAQLNHLAGVLESNEKARRTFMAEIAHDLRTPLAVLRAEIEAMEDGLRPMTPESLASLSSEVELLGRLVGDIQTLSQAEVGMLSYAMREMDLAACLSAVAEASRAPVAARGLRLELLLPDRGIPVFADPARLTQVFRNILGNSVRYTDPGGSIQVRCHREDRTAWVDILDSAPAVPEDQLSLIFERFHTGDQARSRRNSGSGLGLAISKTLIEAHGGHVRALPSPLGGLWIRIGLPVSAGNTLKETLS